MHDHYTYFTLAQSGPKEGEMSDDTNGVAAPNALRPESPSRPALSGLHLQSSLEPEVHFWEATFNAAAPPVPLDDLDGARVLPTTIQREIALEATTVAFGSGAHEIEKASFAEPLIVPEHGEVRVQAVVSFELSGHASFEIRSLVSDRDGAQPASWTSHAKGVIRLGTTAVEASGVIAAGASAGASATPARPRRGRARTAPAGERQFHLETSRPGTLSALVLRASQRTSPGPGEVEIEVRAAGLNFLDVLVTLGAIDPKAVLALALRSEGAASASPALRLGGECAGTVVAVGEGVTEFRVGDDVVALANGSFAAFVTTSSLLVAPKPRHLSFEQAATIPIVFLTAYHALHHVGRIARGERVLIHAAAGGVGLAAIEIARRAGAEIFATAGTSEKREYLRAQGIPHVMDSRSLRFTEEVMERTGGEGVDLVLNSLAGPFIPASFELLRDHGRFIELGKRDYLADRRLGLRPFLRNLSFSLVDLFSMFHRRPQAVRALAREVVARFEARELEPIPHRTFPIAAAADAFHVMANAEHIGKLVLSLEDRENAPIAPEQDEGAEPSAASELREVLLRAPAADRGKVIESYLRELVAEVLRCPPSQVDRLTPLRSLGIDSLKAIELKNQLEDACGLTLPATLVWAYPTIAGLGPHLARKLGLPVEAASPARPAGPPKDDTALSALLGEIEGLSDDGALSLLVGTDRKDKR